MRRTASLAMVAASFALVLAAACGTQDDGVPTGDRPDPSTTVKGPTVTTGPGTSAASVGTTAVPGTQPPGGTVSLKVSGDTSVEASPGQTLELEVADNPSTGYRWSSEVSGDAVEATGSRTAAASDPMPGAPGTETFMYRATHAGTATIKLTSTQAGSGTVGHTYQVAVTVR